MQLQDSISLIKDAVAQTAGPQTWADLGAGSGLFAKALVSILPEGSRVYAVDAELQNYKNYPSSIIFSRANFAKDDLELPPLDGILMANSLHYVHDQVTCIKKVARYFAPGKSRFVLIEYDSEKANRWVPYPVSFRRARVLFAEAGFSHITKLAEVPSVYQDQPIYSALIY